MLAGDFGVPRGVWRAAIAQLVQRHATGWTVGVSNPRGGGEIFRIRPDGRRCQPSLLYNVQWVPAPFLGGNAAGAWRGVHHLHLAPRLKKE